MLYWGCCGRLASWRPHGTAFTEVSVSHGAASLAPYGEINRCVPKKGAEAWDGENEGFPEPPVVLLRVSHAIGDGIALVNVLKKISTALDGGEMRLLDFKRRERASRSFLALLWACVTFIFVCAYGFFKAVLTAAGPYDTKTVFKGSRPPYAFSGKRRVVVTPEGESEPQEYLIPKGKHVSVREGDFVRAGNPFTTSRAHPKSTSTVRS